MIKIKTSNEFEFELDENVFDNMELIDALAECEDNELAMTKVCTLILGKEGKKKLYEHLRKEDGRVPVQDVIDTIKEIFETQSGEDGKN